MSITRSLVTLACDSRRSEVFTAELMLALKLIEKEQITTETMFGSRTGAMWHTQFMSSAYTKYAVDGNGDNKGNAGNDGNDGNKDDGADEDDDHNRHKHYRHHPYPVWLKVN